MHSGTSGSASRCSGKEVAASGRWNGVVSQRWEGSSEMEKTMARGSRGDARGHREACWSSCGGARMLGDHLGVRGSFGSLWFLRKWPPTVKNALGCGFVRQACQEGRWQGKACTREHGKAWPSGVSEAWASSSKGWRAWQWQTAWVQGGGRQLVQEMSLTGESPLCMATTLVAAVRGNGPSRRLLTPHFDYLEDGGYSYKFARTLGWLFLSQTHQNTPKPS